MIIMATKQAYKAPDPYAVPKSKGQLEDNTLTKVGIDPGSSSAKMVASQDGNVLYNCVPSCIFVTKDAQAANYLETLRIGKKVPGPVREGCRLYGQRGQLSGFRKHRNMRYCVGKAAIKAAAATGESGVLLYIEKGMRATQGGKPLDEMYKFALGEVANLLVGGLPTGPKRVGWGVPVSVYQEGVEYADNVSSALAKAFAANTPGGAWGKWWTEPSLAGEAVRDALVKQRGKGKARRVETLRPLLIFDGGDGTFDFDVSYAADSSPERQTITQAGTGRHTTQRFFDLLSEYVQIDWPTAELIKIECAERFGFDKRVLLHNLSEAGHLKYQSGMELNHPAADEVDITETVYDIFMETPNAAVEKLPDMLRKYSGREKIDVVLAGQIMGVLGMGKKMGDVLGRVDDRVGDVYLLPDLVDGAKGANTLDARRKKGIIAKMAIADRSMHKIADTEMGELEKLVA